MERIKIYKDIKLKNAAMVAGWPGMGSVASGVVGYLRRKLKAVKFAEVCVDPMTMLDSVTVKAGLAKLSEPPRNTFYYSKDPELIIFEGESQVTGSVGVELLNDVLDVASKAGTSTIYTAAAFPLPIGHNEMPNIYGVVNNRLLLGILSRSGITPMDAGHISGLNGLVLGFAAARGINAICLLSTMPQYAISLPNPKASCAIIEALQKILGFRIDMLELSEEIKDMDEKMSIIEDKVKDVLTIEKEELHAPAPSGKIIPPYIVDKIEKLFLDAKGDRAKAVVLKRELDRWDLYHAYEDRFLDLFKDKR